MKAVRKYLVLVIFSLVLLSPAIWFVSGKDVILSGVSEEAQVPDISTEGLVKGIIFDEVDTYIKNNLPGRNFMIKVRNQVMFTCVGESPNANILVGKNRNLFESNYLEEYMQISRVASDEYLAEMAEKIERLENELNENNVKLLLFLTPSKATYYSEDIPAAYRYSGIKAEDSNHDRWVRFLDEKQISYYDSLPYLDECKKNGDTLFYKTGTHWATPVAAKVAKEFSEYFEKETGYNLPEFNVVTQKSDMPVYPDADIFNTLNLFIKPYDNYEKAECVVTDPMTDAPNVFFRGGSFMGQSLKRLVDIGSFGKDVHFENNYIHYERYSKSETCSGFNAYDEIDLKSFFKGTDVLILEINEAAIYDMTWGFIDYLLDHPEIIDSV